MKNFDLFIGIFSIYLTLNLVILAHELGHFLVAYFYRVKILNFSLGFGKAIFSWTWKGILWNLKYIPFGGYVKMLDTRESPVTDEQKNLAFDLKPLWVRFLIIFVGPLMNGVMALVCFTLAYWFGYPHYDVSVHKVLPRSPASSINLKAGDKIKKIGNMIIEDWSDVNAGLIQHLGERKINLVVERKGKDKKLEVILSKWEIDPLRFNLLQTFGIVPNKKNIVETKHLGLSALKASLWRSIRVIKAQGAILVKLIEGKISIQSLMGPLSLFENMYLLWRQSIPVICYWLGVFSIAVMLFNILPIPGLDGGHLLYFLIEKIKGSSVSIGIQVLAYRLSTIILYVLLIQILMNDILRLSQNSFKQIVH